MSLSFLELVKVILPLIIIHILISRLGIENYVLIIFAETIVVYFIFILNFGFDLSATKEISDHFNDSFKISEIVSSEYEPYTFFRGNFTSLQ